MFQICPKCTYARKVEDTGSTDICPGCGLVFSKYVEASAKREQALLAARRNKQASEGSGSLLKTWLIGLTVLVALSFVYDHFRSHNRQGKVEQSVPVALNDSKNTADQREFADLFNTDTPLAAVATRGQYTIIEVYLDQCTYCRELEAALQPLRERRHDINLVRVHHPGSINQSVQGNSKEEVEAKLKIINERMSAYQLCGSPHVEVYGPDKNPLAVDTCKNHEGTSYLWNWITAETGIARRSAPGAFTRLF